MVSVMATHSSILAWRIPWTKESGELQFMGWQRVGDNWANNTHTHTHTHTHAHTRKKKKLSRVPWAERRSNQSILKEINPEYSLDGLMPKLKLQYFGHLMQRADSLEKTLKLRKMEGRRRRGWQDDMVGWHHLLNGNEFEQTPRDSEGQENLICCSPWGCKELNITEQLNNNKGKKEQRIRMGGNLSSKFCKRSILRILSITWWNSVQN